MGSIRLWFISAVLFIILIVGAINYYTHQQDVQNSAPMPNTVVTVIDKASTGTPQLGGHYSLTDHHGKNRTDASFKGKIQMIYFGYTFCPDICPTGLSSMTQALNMLGSKADQVVPIFITIDPERDRVAQLATYVQNFHPSLIALTGTLDQIKAVKQIFKVFSAKINDNSSTDYLVDHSSIIYIMDRQGKFVAHFNHASAPSDIAQALKKLI